MERRREEREREERTPCSWSSVKPYGVQWTLYILQFTFLLFSLQNTFLGISFSCFSSSRLIWLLGKLSSSGSSAMKTPILCNLRLREVLTFSEHTKASEILSLVSFEIRKFHCSLIPFMTHAWYLVSKHNPHWTEHIWLLRTPLQGICNTSTFGRRDTFIFVTCSNTIYHRPDRTIILNTIIQPRHWWGHLLLNT